MRSCLYYYHKQNEICLKIALLPFTLIIFVIKKLVQLAKRWYAGQKH